jgi:hypothetical protein
MIYCRRTAKVNSTVRILGLIAGLIFIFPSLFVWPKEVTILVEDMDLGIPLEGAVIHSWDGAEYLCDGQGLALIQAPDDRQVSIQATYPGYESGRMIIPVQGDRVTVGLRLGGVMESRELVIEGRRPGESETKSGRSVAISGEALERSSQIGFIEDVMTSIKLLPGVGYTGMFNAMPSIRGGDPGDLMAVLDGFYIENPYHWGGGFSIFDPHMVQSAQLSHGIFSARYGHTISGLLEVTSKKADPSIAELELGISTSAVNLNASLPLGGSGGLMLMGKVTYWDPFIWAAKQLSKVVDNEQLQMVNAVTRAPYIRSAAANFNYRFNADTELSAEAFIGADGVGADYENESSGDGVDSKSRMVFNWDNLQGFLITGFTFNPRSDMVLKTTAGAGFHQAKIDGGVYYDYLSASYSDDFTAEYPLLTGSYTLTGDEIDMDIFGQETYVNIQGRADFDWDLGKGFVWAMGIHELYTLRTAEETGKMFIEIPVKNHPDFPQGVYFHYPMPLDFDLRNQLYNTSAYTLMEYRTPGQRFGTELGIRADHLYFAGDGFDIQTMPVLNPRLNMDFNVFKNKGIVESLDLTAGTGFFSSMNDAVSTIEGKNAIDDFTLKPNRSWTSVTGVKADFSGGWSFNMEAYFKYVYDRAYQLMYADPGESAKVLYRFDGNGMIWGFDLMFQKFDSRYWDGWLSYTFTHAKYHENERVSSKLSSSGTMELEDSGWYYPYFHRFHNLNLVLNFKPLRNFNIYTRLGLASGRPMGVAGEITSYPVVLRDADEKNIIINPTDKIIQKWKRESRYDNNSRTTWSVPLDVKLSYYFFNPGNKVKTEIYLAAENLLSLVYVAKANTTFNQYTGKEDTGSDSANYEMPIPMASFGIKWCY